MAEARRYTVDEAANALGCKSRLVYKLCEARKLGHVRVGFGRGKIVIDQADLDAYLARCRVVPTEGDEPAPAGARRGRAAAIPDVLGQLRARKGKGTRTRA